MIAQALAEEQTGFVAVSGGGVRRTRRPPPSGRTVADVESAMAQVELAQMSIPDLSWLTDFLEGAARVGDVIIPEEVLGLDITPGWHYFPGGGRAKQYNDVYIKNGKIYAGSADGRMLGYTSTAAKKKFRTRRRRKRLTKRDMYILEVMKETPSAGALALML